MIRKIPHEEQKNLHKPVYFNTKVHLGDIRSILYRISGLERRGWLQFDAAADSTGFFFACPNLSNSLPWMPGDVIKCQTLFPPNISNSFPTRRDGSIYFNPQTPSGKL